LKRENQTLPVTKERRKVMNTKVTKVPYVAIAVKDNKTASEFFVNTFGGEILSSGTVQEELYRECLVKIGDFHLYLMEPMEEGSVIGNYISKYGQGIHHLCFSFADHELAIKELRTRGLRVISKYIEADEAELAFLHPAESFGVLIELSPEEIPFRTK
jgi:methylmalonyl-CoA/ethylmalonyl-CoA epimerase